MSEVIITEFHGGYSNIMLWQRLVGTTNHYGTTGGIAMIVLAIGLAWLAVNWARRRRTRKYLLDMQEEFEVETAEPISNWEQLAEKRQQLLEKLRDLRHRHECGEMETEVFEEEYGMNKKELAKLIYLLRRLGLE